MTASHFPQCKMRTWLGLDLHAQPDLSAIALITIDMQRDTLDGRSFEVAGTSAVLPRVSHLAAVFRAHDLPIVHVVRLYESDGSNAEPCRRQMIQQGPPLLRPGTDGSELAQAILPLPDMRLQPTLLLEGGIQQLLAREVAIYKPRWGAFYRTPLEDHLRGLGVDSLVFTGCNFPNCPRASIYEASERDFRVFVVTDGVSRIDQRGIEELEGIGVAAVTTEELIEKLQTPSRAQPPVARE